MQRPLPVIATALLAFACGGPSPEEPARFESCSTAECRATWATDRWLTDQPAVEEAMGSLEEPIARLALIMAITEAHPGTTAALCAQIPDRIGREHCESINARPHLRVDAPAAATPSTADAARDEALYPRLQLASLEAPWSLEALAPPEVDCPTDFRSRTCWTYTASQEALAGATEGAAASCARIEAGKWRDECLFQAAEVVPLRAEQGGLSAPAVQGATHLCLSAGRFRASCVSHLMHAIAQAAPAVDMEAPEHWHAHAQALEALGAPIAGQEPDLGADVVSQAWARSMHASVGHGQDLTGNPADHVDARWMPHLRAALAVAVVSRTPPPADLAAAQASLDDALLRRGARTPAVLPPGQPEDVPVWSVAPEGLGDHHRIWYLGEMRRFTSRVEEVDSVLVLVEAAARVAPPRRDLIEAASRHPDALVAAVAERHLSRLTP